MNRRRFGFEGITVELTSDHSESLAWAERFLSPYFDTPPGNDRVTWSVEARFNRSGTPPVPPAHAQRDRLFLGRTGYRWSAPDGGEHILDDSAVYYSIGSAGISITYPAESVYYLGDPARLIREYVIDTLCREGGLRLHAGAVAFGNCGILIVGGSGSGKSSTVAQLLKAGADYLSNDRTVIFGEDYPTLFAFPLAIRWSGAQLGWFERGAIFAAAYRRLSELRRSDRLAGYPKYELTPSELSDVTRRPLRDRAPLRLVVLADRGHTERPSTLEQISPDIGRTALHAEILEHDPAFPCFFRQEREHVPAAAADEDTKRLLRNVEWYRLRGAFTDNSAVETLASLCDQVA
jgi:hypothetical protein